MNKSFRRELFDPLTSAMQTGSSAASYTEQLRILRLDFLGLVNTFVRSRARPAHPGFANDPQLLAPRLWTFL